MRGVEVGPFPISKKKYTVWPPSLAILPAVFLWDEGSALYEKASLQVGVRLTVERLLREVKSSLEEGDMTLDELHMYGQDKAQERKWSKFRGLDGEFAEAYWLYKLSDYERADFRLRIADELISGLDRDVDSRKYFGFIPNHEHALRERMLEEDAA